MNKQNELADLEVQARDLRLVIMRREFAAATERRNNLTGLGSSGLAALRRRLTQLEIEIAKIRTEQQSLPHQSIRSVFNGSLRPN